MVLVSLPVSPTHIGNRMVYEYDSLNRLTHFWTAAFFGFLPSSSGTYTLALAAYRQNPTAETQTAWLDEKARKEAADQARYVKAFRRMMINTAALVASLALGLKLRRRG